MSEENENIFLCKKIKLLRTTNNCSMEDLIKKLNSINENVANKSTLSRVESGATSRKTLLMFAEKYCKAFGMTEIQIQQFLRGDRVVVLDTSALLKNTQLIDQLNEEYNKVIIPTTVISELEYIKSISNRQLAKKAWEVLRSISYNDNTISVEYKASHIKNNNDKKIIHIAEESAKKYNCIVDIITDDIDYSAYLKGHKTVNSLHLSEYMKTKQAITNMEKINQINNFYGEDYSHVQQLTKEEVNTYLKDGSTLIISIIRNRKHSFAMKKIKDSMVDFLRCGH